MKTLIEKFPEDLKEATNASFNEKLTTSSKAVANVVICGLGGSGIGGAIASQLFAGESKLPITVCRDYSLPEFVDENTLVIACSYSGNTEETIEALDAAFSAKAEIAVLTSGGRILELALEHGWNHVVVESGQPPRSAFGKTFPQLVRLLANYGIISTDHLEEFNSVSQLIVENRDEIQSTANTVLDIIGDSQAIIYSDPQFFGVGERFRQQLNENAKVLCWHHFYPEMNHNELVGWAGVRSDHVVVRFAHDFEHERNTYRWKITSSVMRDKGIRIAEIDAKGATLLQQAMYAIHVGDWVSLLLAEKRGVDCVEVNVIDHLKSELSKV